MTAPTTTGQTACANGHPIGPGGSASVCAICGAESASAVTFRFRRNSADEGSAEATLFDLPSAGPAPPPVIPGYDLHGEIGRGGMGVVFLATQRSLSRTVAVKMVLLRPNIDAETLTRFRAEAEVVANLRHANIVAVHEIGTCAAGPFLVMEYAPGGSLARRLTGDPVRPRVAAALVRTLAGAIHAAHARGVVHRDLKPGNVLLCEDVSVPLERCTPKIGDFGLARRLEDGNDLTLSGQVIGTPGYMAPEQAGGGRGLVGPRTDVYALGVLLYELLTGRVPYRGSTAMETVHLMLTHDPLPPTRLRRDLPRDLETICLCCLEKDPARRYPTAEALAEDLSRYLEDRPVSARPAGAAERAAKWARRHPVGAALAGFIAVMVPLAFGLIFWQWRRAEDARRAAEAHSASEAESRREAQRLSARLMLERGGNMSEFANVADGVHWLVRALETVPEDDEALRTGVRLVAGGWLARLHTHAFYVAPAGPIRGFCVARYADAFAVARPGAVRAFAADGRELSPSVAVDSSHPLVLATAGGFVTGAAAGGRIELRRVDGTPFVSVGVPVGVRRVLLAPTDDLLLLLLADDTARLYSVPDGKPVGAVMPHPGRPTCAAWSADGSRVLTGCKDGLSRLWDRGGRPLKVYDSDAHRDGVTAVAFSPDGLSALTGGSDRRAILRKVSDGTALQKFPHQKSVEGVGFHPADPVVHTFASDGVVRFWATANGQRSDAAIRSGTELRGAYYSPDGSLFFTTDYDDCVRGYRLKRPDPGRVAARLPAAVVSVAESPDGSRVLVGCADKRVRLYDRRLSSQVVVADLRAESAAWSPDGRRFAFGTYEGTYHVFDAQTGRPAAPPRSVSGSVLALAFAPDGRSLAVAHGDEAAKIDLCDPESGRVIRCLTGHKRKVSSLAFSPGGGSLLSGSWDYGAILWDVATGSERHRVRHEDLVQAVAFRPDGKVYATAGDDFRVRLWDADTGKPFAAPLMHADKLHAVAFSPCGRMVASGGKGGRVRLWEAGQGKPVGPAETLGGEVHSLLFRAGGRSLLAGTWDGVVGELAVPPEAAGDPAEIRRRVEVHTSRRLDETGALRPLTFAEWRERAGAHSP